MGIKGRHYSITGKRKGLNTGKFCCEMFMRAQVDSEHEALSYRNLTTLRKLPLEFAVRLAEKTSGQGL